MPTTPPLSASFGYGIVLGLGFAFAFGMMTITYVLKRYHSEVKTSEMEMFSTAGRTVKPGLVASAVVSSWTWAATLLQSSGVAYRYGVSGPCKKSSAKIFIVQVDREHRDVLPPEGWRWPREIQQSGMRRVLQCRFFFSQLWQLSWKGRHLMLIPSSKLFELGMACMLTWSSSFLDWWPTFWYVETIRPNWIPWLTSCWRWLL